MRIVVFLVAFVGVGLFTRAQTDLQKALEPDSTSTEVVRIKAVPLQGLPRSVKLTPARAFLSNVTPIRKRYKRAAPRSFWTQIHKVGLNLSEAAFVNWNAGGDNAISILAHAHVERNYKFRYLDWNNVLRLRYGLNAQEGRALRKTEDQIRISSSLSFRKDTLTDWYYSVNVNINTQFSDGFQYPNRTDPISRFMAPGYLFLGLGKSYIPQGKALSLYLSPLTLKSTFVLDEVLSNQGAFGVNPGEKVFSEIGFLITNTWQKEILKNVTLNHRITLYTDYLRSFGNIDVDWEVDFTLKVNQFISANLGAHLIYDDDVRFEEVVAEDGTIIDPGTPRIQLKQLLGVGLLYAF